MGYLLLCLAQSHPRVAGQSCRLGYPLSYPIALDRTRSRSRTGFSPHDRVWYSDCAANGEKRLVQADMDFMGTFSGRKSRDSLFVHGGYERDIERRYADEVWLRVSCYRTSMFPGVVRGCLPPLIPEFNDTCLTLFSEQRSMPVSVVGAAPVTIGRIVRSQILHHPCNAHRVSCSTCSHPGSYLR